MIKNNYKQEPDIWKIMGSMLVIGIFLVVIFSSRVELWTEGQSNLFKLINYLSALGIGMLVAGASFSSGGIVGFLFAIPKMLQNPNSVTGNESGNHAMVIHNDNLVQISDWVTKIIVGVSLTQMHNIPDFILNAGDELKVCFGNDLTGRNGAISIILYFMVSGFMAVYLWTRLHFVKLLAQTEEELLDQYDKQKEELEAFTSTLAEEFNLYAKLEDDPEKGKWGGKPEQNSRKVTAKIQTTSFDKNLYKVSFEVTSTDSKLPLTDSVCFHLHPLFKNAPYTIKPSNGIAKLNIITPGAFTVGVECDSGKTKLEIDLGKDVENVPNGFRKV